MSGNDGILRLKSASQSIELPYADASYVMHSNGHGRYPGSELRYQTDWTFEIEEGLLKMVFPRPTPRPTRKPASLWTRLGLKRRILK